MCELLRVNRAIGMQLRFRCRGRSGSGKSSINALLLRYYDPEKGKVTFDGQGSSSMEVKYNLSLITSTSDIREFNPASWRSAIGVVPQVSLVHIL